MRRMSRDKRKSFVIYESFTGVFKGKRTARKVTQGRFLRKKAVLKTENRFFKAPKPSPLLIRCGDGS